MRTGGFLERSVDALLRAMETSLRSERIATEPGLLQRIDARVKVLGVIAVIVSIAIARSIPVVAIVLAVATLLAVAARLPLRAIAARAWTATFLFTMAIAIPALFLTPGRAVAQAPSGLAITEPGLRSAVMLILRVETAVTLALILVFSTPWARILRALRALRIPAVFIVIVEMTSRFIHVLLQTAHDMFESRRSRRVGRLSGAQARSVAAWSGGVLLSKSLAMSDDVYAAMQARGYRGEVRLLDQPRMRGRDWLALAIVVAASAAIIGWGR